jgi:hypothetical protein
MPEKLFVMTTSLDLILLPLHRQNNRDLPENPGLSAAQAPRRTARGRSIDVLMVHLVLEGTAPLSPKGYNKLIGHLVDRYYKTPGSATAAMRSVADWLNNYLIERNLRGASRSMQSIGLLNLAVFRGDRFYLAQCGPTHAFLVNASGLTHYHESDMEGRGLGLGRATHIRYYQQQLSPGDLLLLCADPPSLWTTASLNELRELSMHQMHLQLIHHIGPELDAALIQVESGSGKLRVLRPEPVRARPRDLEIPKEPEIQSSPLESEKTADGESQIEAATTHASSQTADPGQRVVSESIHEPREFQPGLSQSKPEAVSIHPSEEASKREKPKIQRERIIGPALLKLGQAVGDTFSQASKWFRHLIKRMLPDESLLTIPASVMAFIAVAVPLVVVAVAATTYFQRGRAKMYEEHYLQAQYAAEQALQLTGAAELRESWKIVLTHLDKAEVYQTTEDSQSMRVYAMNVLDNLDIIVRLPFQQALADLLPSDVNITRIVPRDGDNEIYLLNGTDGHVFRAVLTEQGYQIDNEFFCEPVPQPLIVGEIVDIIALPLDDPNNAAIMGMDGNGNLMECVPGKNPLTFQMPPPDMNWGMPTAFDMTTSGVYVLDPVTNAVWIFWTNDEFSELPTLFFDESIPPLGDAIDLTINRDDLYLIHEDGHLTTCTFGYPTRCQDPAIINDLREDRENGPMIDDAVFREIQYSPPPDPSIYLLDPNIPAIYHFSVRLSYQRQFRPQYPFSKEAATAFAISQNRQVFLAVGNQVFVAPLP